MGPVNGFLTLASTGLFLGLLIGAGSYEGDGSWSNMFGPVISGIIGGIIGVIGGTVIACLPKVREAFRDIPALYYAPTAISAIGWTIVVFNIWR